MPKIKNLVTDPATRKHINKNTARSLVDYHFICPLPRGVLPSRVNAWCLENCQDGWLMQMPRMGTPTFKDTVIIFETLEDTTRFRDHYCYDNRYHKRPHEADWSDSLVGDIT